MRSPLRLRAQGGLTKGGEGREATWTHDEAEASTTGAAAAAAAATAAAAAAGASEAATAATGDALCGVAS